MLDQSTTPSSESTPPLDVDVLCAGFACHDIIFHVASHPDADEKVRATELLGCGGGLASNGAVAAARLGARTAFTGYVGQDVYGDLHVTELNADNINTDWVVRGTEATALSAVIVKPDGARSIVNYPGDSEAACAGRFDLSQLKTKCILLDGHQFDLAKELVAYAKPRGIPLVIDADSVRPQREHLVQVVDYVVASERFAHQYGGDTNVEVGLSKLAAVAPNVVITLGERGLIWQRGSEKGELAAFPVDAVDTTGAGDVFHGAFAAGLASGMEWDELLLYSSAAGALCCTKQGGRVAIPTAQEVTSFLNASSSRHEFV